MAKDGIAASKRQARAGRAAAPPLDAAATCSVPDPRPASMADFGVRVIDRGAARLRAAAVAEHAARLAAVTAVASEATTWAAATVAAARKALALKTGAVPRPPAPDPARRYPASAGPITPTAIVAGDPPGTPVAALPRRPRAP